MYSNVVGLQQVSVGLTGSWTASQLAGKLLGLSWPLADDLFTVSTPRVAWTLVPASFMAEALVDIPALRVSKTLASIAVQPGGGMQLQASSGHFVWLLSGLAHLSLTSCCHDELVCLYGRYVLAAMLFGPEQPC